MSIIFWVILGIAVAVVLWLIASYNLLVRRKNRVEEAGADIEVQLKRRYDLVPNLVETVKGYMGHEREVFERVTEARAGLAQGGMQEKMRADNALESTLKTLFAVAENYPDLKANANFLELQRELTDTEDKIQAARRFYNTNVRDYNTKLQVLPDSLIAQIGGFKAKEFFQLDSAEEAKAPKVSF